MRHPAAFLACAALVPSLQAQSTTRISVSSSGAQATNNSFRPSLSADGRYVVFDSMAPNLVAGDTNAVADVFVRDRLLGTTTRVSLDSSGAQGDGYSYGADLSADGRFVSFWSTATNLVPGDTNGTGDVFVRDLTSNQTTRASVSSLGGQGNDYSTPVFLSGDGRYVGFFSYATNLVGGDTNGKADAFVHDMQTGRTTRVSVSSSGAQANADCTGCGISADGRYAVFFSSASSLVAGDTNGTDDVFLRDLQLGTTTRISVDSSGAQSNGNSGGYLLTPDARYVLFSSSASNLVPGDTNGFGDVFVRDTLLGTTTRVSLDSLGQQADAAAGLNAISSDGRFVVFLSTATNFVPGDTNGALDVFVRDRTTGQTLCASVGPTGLVGNSYSYGGKISADGRLVAFESGSSNLVPGDTGGFDDVFLRDRGTIAATAFCFGDGTQPSACPCSNSGAAGHGCENSAGTGGALLAISGFADPDSALLTAGGMPPNALANFLQGSLELSPAVGFGDGLLCAGGTLLRLYVNNATGGAARAPAAGDLPLGVRSGLLGDPLVPGASRTYQTWYRDLDASFCPAPAGDLWNITNAVRVDW